MAEHTRRVNAETQQPWNDSTEVRVSAYTARGRALDARDRGGITGVVPRRHDDRFDSWEWKAQKFASDHLGVTDDDEEAAAVDALRRIGWPDRFDTIDAAIVAASAATEPSRRPYASRRTSNDQRDRYSGRESRRRAA